MYTATEKDPANQISCGQKQHPDKFGKIKKNSDCHMWYSVHEIVFGPPTLPPIFCCLLLLMFKLIIVNREVVLS